ncbi:hypothetical protein BGX29_006478 [Mortierella sp. GBA35]|nr:hypothetical protein BGX29_006478 [Mortierella sp. GBA35]
MTNPHGAMTTYPDHQQFPPSSSDNSDSEDLYGGSELDEPHPTSDSELVSHPSDNEDQPSPLSSSPSPAHSVRRYKSDSHHTRRTNRRCDRVHDSDDTDDDDDVDGSGVTGRDSHPTHSLSGRSHHTIQHRDGEQDDFLFVESSDLETSSRPHSAFSQHSDHERPGDAMNLIYPTMTLTEYVRRTSLPQVDDAHELTAPFAATLTAATGLVGTANAIEIEQSDSHAPPAHDIPATLDSSLETISGQQQQLSSEPGDNHNLQEQSSIGHEEQGDESTEEKKDEGGSGGNGSDNELDTYSSPLPRTVQDTTISPTAANLNPTPRIPHAGDKPLNHAKTDRQDHSSVKGHTDHPAQQHIVQEPYPSTGSNKSSTGRSFIKTLATFTGLAGILSLVLVGGFMTVEFYYRSLQPAHITLSEKGVTYADDHRLAVVNLDVFSSRLRQEKHVRRPPGFHVRVLNDNNLWSLQDAPAQPLYLFAEPIVVCPDGGTCQVYVASLQKRHKKNPSPWLCHDTGYYVHIWFANGTRVPLSPPEVFTTRGKSDRKPLACLSPATFIRTSHDGAGSSTLEKEDGDDDYIAYWKERWQQMSGAVSDRFSNMSQTAVYQDPFQPVVTQAKAMVQVAVAYYRQSTDKVIHMLTELKSRLFRTKTKSRASSTLDRVRSNAKAVQARVSSELHELGGRIPFIRSKQEKARRQAKIPMEEQARAFKKAVEDQFDSITADKVLRVADEVFAKAEASLEAILDTEAVKDLAKKVRAEEIMRATERVVLKTEEQLDALLHSELARNVNRDLQRLVDDFKATPKGGKIVQEAQDLQSEAKRRLRSLQRQFRLIRLER